MSLGVKANWHVEVDEASDDDPLGQRTRIEDVGRPIDLSGSPELNRRLADTINREGALADRDVTCGLKHDRQVTCSACPLRHVDPLDAMTPLCDLGVEQERLITRLRILDHGDSG